MNYNQFEKQYEYLIEKYYPIDHTNPDPKLESELNDLMFDIDIFKEDLEVFYANVMEDLYRLERIKKNKISEEKRLKEIVPDGIFPGNYKNRNSI